MFPSGSSVTESGSWGFSCAVASVGISMALALPRSTGVTSTVLPSNFALTILESAWHTYDYQGTELLAGHGGGACRGRDRRFARQGGCCHRRCGFLRPFGSASAGAARRARRAVRSRIAGLGRKLPQRRHGADRDEA